MLFFEDEAAFGRMNHVRRCWVHRPDRAIVKKQAVREYLYAFTTVCPQTGETCSIISPFCNTKAMNSLLYETSIAFPNYRIIMIMDNNYTFDSLDAVDKQLGIALCDLHNEKNS